MQAFFNCGPGTCRTALGQNVERAKSTRLSAIKFLFLKVVADCVSSSDKAQGPSRNMGGRDWPMVENAAGCSGMGQRYPGTWLHRQSGEPSRECIRLFLTSKPTTKPKQKAPQVLFAQSPEQLGHLDGDRRVGAAADQLFPSEVHFPIGFVEFNLDNLRLAGLDLPSPLLASWQVAIVLAPVLARSSFIVVRHDPSPFATAFANLDPFVQV